MLFRSVGLTQGNGKNAVTFGSVTAHSSDGEFVVNVSGFKDSVRREIFDNWEQKYKGSIFTVCINNITKPTKNNMKHSAFLPRFVEFRPEKTEPDSLQRIIDQYDSVIKRATK